MSKSKKQIIVYNYGGPLQDTNHFTSIATRRLARTGLKGLKPANKSIGDFVLITSFIKHTGEMRVSSGIYLGIDPTSPDPWQDPDANYDRKCVEKFKYIGTIIIPKDELGTISRRYLNDNGNASEVLLEKIFLS